MLNGVILEVGLFSCSFAARSDDRGREGVVQVIIAGVMSGLIFGAFIGILFAYFFFRPVVPRGATRRIVQKIHVAAIIGMGAVFWAQAMGGGSSGQGSPSLDIAVGWALAPGYTIGAGWLVIRRWRQYQSTLVARPSPPVRNVAGAPRRRILRSVIRSIDYLIGVGLILEAYVLSVMLGSWLRDNATSWLAQVGLGEVYLADALIFAGGFAYSQLVTGGALRAMQAALRHDWLVSRNRHYVLLGVPFLVTLFYLSAMAASKAAAAPAGLLAGLVTQLVTLYVGWRYTSDRPQGLIKTAQLVRDRVREQRRQE